jgi:polyhydroxyalkanoate synthesis repressor PhaR
MPVIKRYSNRKLYDTESKRYVTLEDLGDFIRQGEDVRVVDHVTGEDLTSVTLMQVIFEEEKKIGGLLPQVFLTRLIQAGGTTVSTLRSRLAAIDPFQIVDEEIRRRVSTLVEEGRIAEQEGAHILDLLVRKPAQAAAVRIPVKPADGSEPPPPDAEEDLADPQELEALQRQVAALEQQLELLRRAA